MSVDIHVKPDDAWNYFQKNKQKMQNEEFLVAEDTRAEVLIWMTEEKDMPKFSVTWGDDLLLYEEGTVSEPDCVNTAKAIYERYLLPTGEVLPATNFQKMARAQAATKNGATPSARRRREIEDKIVEREDELEVAACLFLEAVMQEDDVANTYGEDFIQMCMDELLQSLANQDIDIYRPMIMELEEAQGEIYTEFPYDPDAKLEKI